MLSREAYLAKVRRDARDAMAAQFPNATESEIETLCRMGSWGRRSLGPGTLRQMRKFRASKEWSVTHLPSESPSEARSRQLSRPMRGYVGGDRRWTVSPLVRAQRQS